MKKNFDTLYDTIRRISILMMLALSLMPIKGMGENLVYDDTNPSNYIQLDFSADYGTADYLCMYILDNEENLVDIAGYSPKFKSNEWGGFETINTLAEYGYYWAGLYKSDNYVIYDKTKNQYGSKYNFIYSLTPTSTSPIHNYTIVVKQSNDPDLLTQGKDFIGTVTKEYTYKVYTKSGLESSTPTKGSLAPNFSSFSTTKIVNADASPSGISLNLPRYGNPKYLRWDIYYDGSLQNTISWYNGGNTASSSDMTYKLTKDADKEWNKYKVVCTWANDDTDAETVTYQGTNYIIKEPTLNGKYTWNIAAKTSSERDITLNEPTGSETTINLNALMSGTDITLPLSDIYTDIQSAIGSSDNLYVRIKLPDGNAIYSSSADNITTDNDNYQAYNGKYFLWNVTDDNNGEKNIATLVKQALALTMKNTSAWTSGTIQCAISSSPATISGGLLTEEPSSYNLVLNVNLKQLSDLSFTKTSDLTGATLREYSKIIGDADPSATITIDETKLIADLGGNSENVYMRWMIKENGTDVTSSTVITNDQWKQTNGSDLYWYSKASSSSLTAGVLSVTFTPASGKTFADYDVQLLITSNLDGMETIGDYVTKEPSAFSHVYKYNFYTPSTVPFVHYEGIANARGDYNDNGTQKVHEYTYYYYVKGNEPIELTLPLDKYNGSGDVLEPQGWFRWFDWDTDGKSDYISPYNNAQTKLKQLPGNKGLNAFKIGAYPTRDLIGVYYTAPAEADNADWEDEVACDVSRYHDGIDPSGQYMLHEPTLGIRYRYVIRSTKWIADELKRTLTTSTKMKTFEDQKTVSMGVASDLKGKFALRLNYDDIKRYYFHPLTESGKKKHVYHPVGEAANHIFEESDFQSDVVQARGTIWYIYNKEMDKYATTNGTERKLVLSVDDLNGLYPKNVTDDTSTGEAFSFGIGSKGYIVVYLTDGSGNLCPVANMEFEIQNSAPMLFEDLSTNAPERTIENIESKYSQSTDPISFDNVNRDQTLAAATKENNITARPSKWSLRQYSFVYKDLINYTHIDNYWAAGFSAMHGDYGIYKSACVDGISKNGMYLEEGNYSSPGLYSWYTDVGAFYDRTHAMTNGAQTGYFLYVDASEESRPIASADFEADLCSGSAIVVSAAVASITNGGTKPQIMFKLYGVDDKGNISQETLLHSFASGDFAEVTGFAEGKWMQVYANVTLSSSSGVGNYDRFRLVIDNYCPNTSGADYAIDDIRIYQRISSVETIVDKSLCDDGNVAGGGEATLTIRAKYESLQAKAQPFVSESKTLYFRIIDEDGKVVEYDFDSDGNNEQYGSFSLPKTAPDDISKGSSFLTVNEELYFIIAKGSFGLVPGKKYYISMSFEDPSASGFDPSAWGNPMDACSVYSEWFMMEKQQIVVKDATGKVLTTIGMSCGGDFDYEIHGELQVADPVNGGTMNISGLKFDWYLGTKSEFNSVANLKQAWDAFRQEYPDVTDKKAAKGTFTDEYKAVLDKEIDEKRLFLAAKDKIDDESAKIPFTIHSGLTYMCALVITDNGSTNQVTVGDKKYTVCPEPMEFSFRVIKDGPKVNLGFNNETYPSEPIYRSVRLGLMQLQKDNIIELPLHSTELIPSSPEVPHYYIKFDKNQVPETNQSIFISATNDPKMDLSTTKKLFTIEDYYIDHLDKDKEEAANQRTLKVKATDVAQELHEGYWYELNFDYKQYNDDEEYNPTCPGTTYFRILVVPEYLTWTPTADGAMSNNWNNDLNWRRSTQETLYKNDRYPKYDGSAYPATQQSYIPMKFSKVTMETPVNTPGSYPYLNYIKTSSTGLATSLSNKMYAATKDVEYDIMVKVNPESSGNYGCERFYGNTCREIYFKPEGELRNQQYLEYQKAWVEKEMDIDKWYILGSPLKDVVAGDMYMPKNNGRQETEAFNDIYFNTTEYSRTAYPVYQRTWDTNAPKEISPDGEYSAWHQPESVIPDDISFTSLMWSHVYNDVTERYDNTGFSIKAGDAYYPTDNRDEKVLFRLPKADKQYTYYNPDGTTEGKSETIGERMSVNNLQIDKDFMEDASGATRMTLSDNYQHQSDFVMLYNPYMSTLDIKKFISANANSIDGSEFWTMKASETESGNVNVMEKVTEGYIAPMQAFFVKKQATAETVNFTAAMTVDAKKSRGTAAANDGATISIKASNSRGTSYARVAIVSGSSDDYDNAEDTEMISDANIGDIPQIYTVAGGKTLALNTLPYIDWLPIGILADNDDEVEATFSGLSKDMSPMYLYDAKTSQFIPLDNDSVFRMKGNAFGRYYLTSHQSVTGVTTQTEDVVHISRMGNGMVVVQSPVQGLLSSVMICSLSGNILASARLDGVLSWTCSVPSDIVVVKVTTSDGTVITRKFNY